MSSSNNVLLSQLKTTVRELIADLSENIFTSKEEKSDMALVDVFFECMSESQLMNHTIINTLPFAEQIKARDVHFFTTQKDKIFEGLPSDRIDYFEKLITTSSDEGGMSDENKNVIWDYFNIIVAIAEKYKKNQ